MVMCLYMDVSHGCVCTWMCLYMDVSVYSFILQTMGLIVISDVNNDSSDMGILYVTDSDSTKNLDSNVHILLETRTDESLMPTSYSNNVNMEGRFKIRTFFPETWLWTDVQSETGKTRLNVTVPETITSWVLSAFATNKESGLGVAPVTSKLRVTRPFFVSLTYPRSVVRNEQFVIQATVFNYLNIDLFVSVVLTESKLFKSIKVFPNGTEVLKAGQQASIIKVKSNNNGIVYFPMSAIETGTSDINVRALSSVASDGVRQKISIKHEGATVIYNRPVFISLSKSSFEKNVTLPLPDSMVKDSPRIRVKVTGKMRVKVTSKIRVKVTDKIRVKMAGDLIGSSLHSTLTFLSHPAACLEQSLTRFSPYVYIGKYLKATGQLTNELKTKITGRLSAGLQLSSLGHWQKQDNCGDSSTCHLSQFTNNIRNGTRYLETQLQQNNVTCPYMLAVVSYALAKAKSPVAVTVFNKLLSLSVTEGNLQYWTTGIIGNYANTQSSRYNRPLRANSVDILITSYAILTFISLNRIEEALPAVRWLTSQKKADGSFVSSQDTILGLKALSTFASNTFRTDTNVLITVTDAVNTVRMNVTNQNALTLQIQELKEFSERVNIKASGVGVSLLDIDLTYNVLKEISAPAFEVYTIILEDKLDIFNLMICIKYVFNIN
ncbi:hypothetical protein Btru_038419 [Bulinus truncatus]|nr:hypothetical protein Btru_038419 [Bulinus truncatus]